MTSPESDRAVELLPCPFCGGPARVFQKYRDHKPLNWRVACDNDDPQRGQLCAMDVVSDFDTEAEAITAWNRRATAARDAAASEMMGALEEIARLRLATSEGTLAHRTDKMWELAGTALSSAQRAGIKPREATS